MVQSSQAQHLVRGGGERGGLCMKSRGGGRVCEWVAEGFVGQEEEQGASGDSEGRGDVVTR